MKCCITSGKCINNIQTIKFLFDIYANSIAISQYFSTILFEFAHNPATPSQKDPFAYACSKSIEWLPKQRNTAVSIAEAFPHSGYPQGREPLK